MNSPIGTNRAIFLKRNLNGWVCGRPRPAANPALFKRGGIFNASKEKNLFEWIFIYTTGTILYYQKQYFLAQYGLAVK